MPEGGPTGARRLVGLLVVVLLVVGSSVAGTASAATQTDSTAPSETLVVALQADGSATVTLRTTFDLTTDGDRETFRELRRNDSRTAQVRESFAAGLRATAAAAAAETGRSMRVENASTAVSAADDTGTVAVSATWTGLAATDGERLTLSTPFDAGFDPAGAFVVRAPEGYALSASGPAPDAATERSATWDATADLSGFSVTAEPAATTAASPTATGSSGPGFGAPAALGALAALSALTAWRRRDRRA